MFSNLIFLIIVLLLISMAPLGLVPNWSYFSSFIAALGVYALLLGIILLQNKLLKRIKALILLLVNLELILFLCLYQYYFSVPNFFGTQVLTPYTLFSLALYLGGLAFYHYTSFSKRRFLPDAEAANRSEYTGTQLRMIFPFAIPFLLFTFLMDAIQFIPNQALQNFLNGTTQDTSLGYLLLGFSLFFMVLMMIFLPAVIKWIWKCRPLPNNELHERFEALCKRAEFRHGGMLTWTIMNDSLTAAIVGVLPRYRYVMFTKRLLRDLSPNAIEAILAHEIGHSYRKHLLIYPLILLGMFVMTGLYSYFIGDALTDYFNLQNQLYPGISWEIINALVTFIAYAAIIALYFRFVFGYFSRLFERQADLHVFHLGVNPDYMIEALDEIATRSGNIHALPSWHHFGIQKRIDFIKAAKADPKLIEKHNFKVKMSVWIYLLLLVAAIIVLF